MYVKPHEACDYFNVSDQCLRTWAKQGKIKYKITKGGHRRYLLPSTKEKEDFTPQKVIYARVSSKKQRGDLEIQIQYLQERYPEHNVISDIGSGINSKRVGFKRILDGVFKGTIKEVVVAHRDRWSRFGYELFEWIFEEHGSQLICDDIIEIKDENEELSEDLMAIITVFSSRYHGKRRYKNL